MTNLESVAKIILASGLSAFLYELPLWTKATQMVAICLYIQMGHRILVWRRRRSKKLAFIAELIIRWSECESKI